MPLFKASTTLHWRKQRFHSENASSISIHNKAEEFENAKITRHLAFQFEENSARDEIT